MPHLSRKLLIIFVFILFLLILLFLTYKLFLSEKIQSLPDNSPIKQVSAVLNNTILGTNANITLKSEVDGYRLSFNNGAAFDEILNETKYFALPHRNLNSDEVYHVKNIVITLSKNEQKSFQVYSGKDKTLSYASTFNISGGTLYIDVYVNLKFTEVTSQEKVNLINMGLTSRILHPLFVSASITTREQDLLLDKYVFSRSQKEIPFSINKI